MLYIDIILIKKIYIYIYVYSYPYIDILSVLDDHLYRDNKQYVMVYVFISIIYLLST